ARPTGLRNCRSVATPSEWVARHRPVSPNGAPLTPCHSGATGCIEFRRKRPHAAQEDGGGGGRNKNSSIETRTKHVAWSLLLCSNTGQWRPFDAVRLHSRGFGIRAAQAAERAKTCPAISAPNKSATSKALSLACRSPRPPARRAA